jgi:hypothetical protein
MLRALIGGMVLMLAAAPADTGWSIDKPVDKIPDAPLKGEIFGRPLSKVKATFSDMDITIQSEEKVGGWPASKLIIFSGKDDRGKEIVVTPASEGMLPHIHMNTAVEGRGFPGTLMYTEMYSMRLVTKEKGRALECAIHLSLPDYKKSYLVGTFTATRGS